MEIEELACIQDATYWAKSGQDKYGNPTVSAPVDLKVRWEHTERNILTAEGETIARGITVDVLQDIVEGSIMRLGTVDDLPDAPDKLFEVATFDSTPDIDDKNTQRSVTLFRYAGALPTIV